MTSEALTAARDYARRGLGSFPLIGKAPAISKEKGGKGLYDATTNDARLREWFAERYRNIGIAIPDGIYVLDIDTQHDGHTTFRELCQEYGAEWLDAPRQRTGQRGVHLWFKHKLDGKQLEYVVPEAPGFELGRVGRYVVAAPSISPITKLEYEWEVPLPDNLRDLPELPAWLVEMFTDNTPERAPGEHHYEDGDDPLNNAAHAATSWPDLLGRHGWTLTHGDGHENGSLYRHPNATAPWSASLKNDCLFVYSSETVFPQTISGRPRGITLYRAISILEHGNDARATSATLRAAGYLPELPEYASPMDLVPTLVAEKRATENAAAAAAAAIPPGIPEVESDAVPPEPDEAEPDIAAESPEGLLDGGTDNVMVPGDVFIFDETVELEVRWGHKEDVLWAAGESVMIVGPPGVGKTTIAHQLVAGLLGLNGGEVLGLPVTEATRVLYLAMDRPRQIRRAMRRLFRPQDRETLHERLLVRRGPLPQDLAKHPELLVELALEHDCDVVVIDSLKDAAIKLSDDETGGGVNRAIQWCNAENIDVCTLHHQRKGESGVKPNTLADVYGSAWLTAGTGSVVLLWGEAGSEQIEMIHLKQPAEPVGPWNLKHDHHAGTTVVVHSFDLLACLRHRGAAGLTAFDAAKAEHPEKAAAKKLKSTGAEAAKSDRTLRKFTRADPPLARREEGGTDSEGRFQPARYFALNEVGDLIETPVDNSEKHRDAHRDAQGLHDAVTQALTDHDAFQETPGHSRDASVT